MSSAQPTIPPDDPKRSLTIAQLENLPHIGLVGDTYTITLTGEQTAGRFCVIDMHIPPGGGPPPHRHDFEETFILLEGGDGEREKTAPHEGGRAREAARCVPNAFVFWFCLARHRRMSPSDRVRPGRRAYIRGRQSGRRREAT